MDSFDNSVNNIIASLNSNEYIAAALATFLVLYSGLAAPNLPESIAKLFSSNIFKFLIIFLIAYNARSNPTVALIATIAFIVSLQALNKWEMRREMMNAVSIKMAGDNEYQGMATINGDEVMDDDVSMSLGEGAPGCSIKSKYRSSFYPQYVNMKTDAYQARYSGEDVDAYEENSNWGEVTE